MLLSVASICSAQTLSLPYFCGFEDAAENANWVLNSGPAGNTAVNKWYVSNAEVYAGDSALNISNTHGATATYGNTTVAIVAYRDITLPAGTYDLSFTYNAGGEANLDGLYACWVNGTQVTNSSAMSAPSWVNNTAFTINTAKMQSLTGGWKVATQTITSTGAPMKLVFVWVNNGSNVTSPGGCIDNVQIANQTPCSKPTNVTANANGSTIVVTWSGSASSYDLMYRSYGNPDVTTITGITGNSYTINGLGEGIYDFMVRSDCNGDTSIYVIVQNQVVYDPNAHCIDFRDLTAPGTTCTYGSYTSPTQTTGIINNGPDQMSSRHTVHYIPGETDPRTLNGLTTIPKGEVVSVRLGNWNNGSEAETVTYTYTVPANSNVIMLLKYAVVFEEPGHSQPPEFNMEITNLMGQSIGTCTEATFLCDGSLTDATWHCCQAPGSYGSLSTIWWKEWTTVGFNLSQYAGQTLKIKFTTKDCNASGHFGYAYYALSCSEAAITGLSCGDVLETSVQAPDGFNYQWYKKSQPSIILGTDQTFSVTGSDTATYVCKVINKEKPSCFFTLEASLLPRSPKAQFTPQWTPVNCQNALTLLNTSTVVTTRGVTSEKPEYYKWFVIDSVTGDTITNGIGTESPNIPVPNEGGSYIIELVAAISGGMCQDTMHILYNVPEIHEVHDTIIASTCAGTPYIFNGQRYTQTGIYQAMGKAIGGCDSIVTLDLTVVDQILTDRYDTICEGDYFEFNNNKFTKTGDYKGKFQTAAGCDSLVTLHLYVFDPVAFDTVTQSEIGAPFTGFIELHNLQPGWHVTVTTPGGAGADSLLCDTIVLSTDTVFTGLDARHYYITVTNQFGCISEIYDIELKRICVNAYFTDTLSICGEFDASSFAPFRFISGSAPTYSLRFSADAQKEFFHDVDSIPIDTATFDVRVNTASSLTDPLPPHAGYYDVDVLFNDLICGSKTVPLRFLVRYPETVIEQRWNDVLAVLTKNYNYADTATGYDFIEFQWYRNDSILPGETRSYIYLGEGNTFDYVTPSMYSVDLIRLGDTTRIRTCPITPVLHNNSASNIIIPGPASTYIAPHSTVALRNVNAPGYASWYSVTGQLIARYDIDQFNAEIIAPSVAGVFLLEVASGSERNTFKMVVTQ